MGGTNPLKSVPNAGLTATGRLFSGSVQTGDQVYLVGAEKEYIVKRVSMYMGAFREAVNRGRWENGSTLVMLERGICIAMLNAYFETLVDVPIVVPSVALGVSLSFFWRTIILTQ
jgi:uncharacterized membrane protein (DUF485 family)